MAVLNGPRSAQLPPFEVVDHQAPGPPLWSYNFIRASGTDANLSGVFVTKNGIWKRFTGLVISSTASGLRQRCIASGITWDDDYIGMIITSVTGGDFHYCIGCDYDGTIHTNSDANTSCPEILAGSYLVNPIVVGRVFKS